MCVIQMMSDYMFGSAMSEMMEFQVRFNTLYAYVFKYRSWRSYTPPWRGTVVKALLSVYVRLLGSLCVRLFLFPHVWDVRAVF